MTNISSPLRLLFQFKLDDPLDAVAVHGGAGMVGVLCAPIFAYQTGILWTSDAWSSLGQTRMEGKLL